MIDLTNIKMLNNDILVRMRPKTDVEGSRFILKESVDDSELQFFTVLAKAEKVTDVEIGETIILSWKDITPPFEAMFYDEKMNVGITDIEKIQAILD